MKKLFTNKKGNPILIVFIILIVVLFLGGAVAAFKVGLALKQIPAWAWILILVIMLWWMFKEKK